MNSGKRIGALAAGLLLSTGLAACGSGPASGESGGKLQLGVVVNDTTSFVTEGHAGIDAYAAANHIDVKFYSSRNDLATQASQLDQLIAAHVDGIMVIPVVRDSLDNQVKAAKDAHIPLVVVNAELKSDQIAGNLIPADEKAGGDITKLIGDKLGGKGNIVVLQGVTGQSAQLLRDKGIHDVLKAKYPGIRVLATDTGEWSRDVAANKMANWITAFGGRIDGVIAQNDDMALGALQALREAGLKVPVVGIDGIEDGLRAVKSGDMLGTALQHGTVELAAGLALTVNIIHGHANDLKPKYVMPLVTATNVDDFMANVVTDKEAFLKRLPELLDRNLKSGDISNEN